MTPASVIQSVDIAIVDFPFVDYDEHICTVTHNHVRIKFRKSGRTLFPSVGKQG